MKAPAYKQPAPFTIKLEATEGCNLACWFCGIQSIRDNGADRDTQTHGTKSSPYKFMTLETASLLADEVARLGWNPRWELAGRGEPSMNQNLEGIVSCIRGACPQATIILTTNGAGLAVKTARIENLFKAGLNSLCLDDYKHADFVPKIRRWLGTADLFVPAYEYPAEPEGNPYRRTKPNQHRIIFLRDLTLGGGVRNAITNQGGASGTKKVNLQEPCAKPFRELTIRWDGRLALCCDDWPGHFKIGSIHDTPLDELWQHPHLQAARRYLLRGQRVFKPCAGCDVRTRRNGLLPDKYGKDKPLVPLPDITALQLVRTAVAGPVQTPKI